MVYRSREDVYRSRKNSPFSQEPAELYAREGQLRLPPCLAEMGGGTAALVQLSEVLDGADHLRGVAVLVVARRKRRAGIRPLFQLSGSEASVPVSDILSRFSSNKRLASTTTPPIFVGLLLSSESLSYLLFIFNISKNYVNESIFISFSPAIRY